MKVQPTITRKHGRHGDHSRSRSRSRNAAPAADNPKVPPGPGPGGTSVSERSHPTMLSQDVDAIDGRPVWACEESDELVPGIRAIEPLGAGVRCETWLAWSVELWAPVVVKLARPHQRDHPRAAAALRREVAGLSGHGHPALPRLWRDGTTDPLPHVVLEYVDGPTVAEVVDETGPQAAADVAQLGAQLLPALLALHDRGLGAPGRQGRERPPS